VSVFLAPVLCLPQAAPQAGADPFLAAQQEGVAKNPKALTFTIRLKDDKVLFQQGEIIRVELAFSSTLPKTYQLNGATYDRSDRLDIDSYHVDPTDGVVDPLKDKVRNWLGGIRLEPILEEKPYLIVRELNEYLRFDKPGKYRLYVVSQRVGREPTDKERAAASYLRRVHEPATSTSLSSSPCLRTNRSWATPETYPTWARPVESPCGVRLLG
jgi:hypothetical protein